MDDWFRRSEHTTQLPVIPPESPSEQTVDLDLSQFATPRHRPLHDWLFAQMPAATWWPPADPDID
ncbi:hypothetical protein [Amycolatopsis minnesotensis]|uniref:hypothetical protein n=1 Tax=Amycolatopsis minnesotensis TaxID=337894 RepID=UPI0031E105BD